MKYFDIYIIHNKEEMIQFDGLALSILISKLKNVLTFAKLMKMYEFD